MVVRKQKDSYTKSRSKRFETAKIANIEKTLTFVFSASIMFGNFKFHSYTYQSNLTGY